VSVSSSQHTIKEKQLDPLHCSRAHLFPLQKWPHVSNLLPTPSSAIIMTSFSLTFTSPLLPSSSTTVDSPAISFAVASAVSGPTITIRNRLVKQAACSYLQPSTPTPSSNPSFLRRVSSSFIRLVSAFFDALLRIFPSPQKIFRA